MTHQPNPRPDAGDDATPGATPPADVHVYVLLDRSGSMAAMVDDVIGGFNGLLADQRADGADARMTFVQFDTVDVQHTVADAVPIAEVLPLDRASFQPRGGTPLLDASGNQVLTDRALPMTAMGVQLPYLAFAAVFILLAVVVGRTHLPQFISAEKIEKGIGALRYPHLVFGMVAIFVYVGAEVSIGSLFINFAQEVAGLAEITAKSFLAYYWGGLMIGRFLGAISLGDSGNSRSMYLKMAVSALAIYALISGIVLFESLQSGEPFRVASTLPYLGFMALQFLGFMAGKSRAARTMVVFSVIIIGLLVAATFGGGHVALWTVIAVGLFNSIMWSNVFTLAIRGLGQHTSQGSSLLVMMILGGAIVPLVQGWFADQMGGYQASFFIPIVCYAYLVFYGLRGHRVRAIA